MSAVLDTVIDDLLRAFQKSANFQNIFLILQRFLRSQNTDIASESQSLHKEPLETRLGMRDKRTRDARVFGGKHSAGARPAAARRGPAFPHVHMPTASANLAF